MVVRAGEGFRLLLAAEAASQPIEAFGESAMVDVAGSGYAGAAWTPAHSPTHPFPVSAEHPWMCQFCSRRLVRASDSEMSAGVMQPVTSSAGRQE